MNNVIYKRKLIIFTECIKGATIRIERIPYFHQLHFLTGERQALLKGLTNKLKNNTSLANILFPFYFIFVFATAVLKYVLQN